MVELDSVVSYCHKRLNLDSIIDFDNAENGLQLENNGRVTKIAASVDAGLIPLQQASQAKADLLLCHHGLFWSPITPIKDHNYKKIKTAMDNNIAVLSAHLPLDCHPEIGNNALLAKALNLEVIDTFLEYKGTHYSFICQSSGCTRMMLTERLKTLFPKTFSSILYGSETPEKIAILTGSGQSAVPYLKAHNIDTLITGELKQHHFNMAQEMELNLYPCGHYATETFGVKALAEELANHFKIEWTFLDQDCLI
ncbi:MAG: Nif3-like dinuclear metal center hexameric protein [Verrucomicrobia bacterium]|nr:Nif3-like dinuclear metal center hexameric protein [Verrucomicrobiota bacterium]